MSGRKKEATPEGLTNLRSESRRPGFCFEAESAGSAPGPKEGCNMAGREKSTVDFGGVPG